MNSSTDKSRFWKRLVWFEAIFQTKNAPELLARYVYNKNRSICMQMNSRALDLKEISISFG